MPASAYSAALDNDLALAPVAARVVTLTGAALDLLNYDGLAKIRLHGVRATGDLTPTIEDSADGTTGWAVIPAGALDSAFTAITAGTDFLQSRVLEVGIVKRFIRFIGTAANTPSHTYGATVSAKPKYRP